MSLQLIPKGHSLFVTDHLLISRYIKIQGLLTTLILGINSIWIASSSFTLHYNKGELILFFLLLILFWTLYFFFKKIDVIPRPIIALFAFLIMLLYTKYILILSYLVCTTNQPLVNSTLDALDSSLGFNTSALFYWFQAHPIWNTVFTYIYMTPTFQTLFLIFYFGFLKNPLYLQRFILLFMISTPLTILLAGLFPAVGTYAWYSYAAEESQLKVFHHFCQLRQNILNLKPELGIVEFPSFHTTIALMYVYTFRDERKMIFIPLLLLNLLMIFSCLSQGGHYLTDILGGIAVFILVVGIEKILFWRLSNKSIDKKNLPDYKQPTG